MVSPASSVTASAISGGSDSRNRSSNVRRTSPVMKTSDMDETQMTARGADSRGGDRVPSYWDRIPQSTGYERAIGRDSHATKQSIPLPLPVDNRLGRISECAGGVADGRPAERPQWQDGDRARIMLAWRLRSSFYPRNPP